jgi:hypothetical protein
LEHIYTNNRPLTARLLRPGDRYFTNVMRKVPKNMMGMYCEVCGTSTMMPLRLGFAHAESVRVRHLTEWHGLGLEVGTVTLDEQA